KRLNPNLIPYGTNLVYKILCPLKAADTFREPLIFNGCGFYQESVVSGLIWNNFKLKDMLLV
ncbi:MAG: hypothetical protein WBG61_10920, partial [Desulfobacterales bacterium]